MTVKWRHCAIAERDHRKDVRNYAHTYHYPQTICLAKDFWKLPREYRDGVLLHEIGHLLAGPDGSESDANDAVFDWAGAQIEYVDSPYGRRLERLSNMPRIARRRRNPAAPGDILYYHGPTEDIAAYGERVKVLRFIPAMSWIEDKKLLYDALEVEGPEGSYVAPSDWFSGREPKGY